LTGQQAVTLGAKTCLLPLVCFTRRMGVAEFKVLADGNLQILLKI
jgi:hypothetical protein